MRPEMVFKEVLNFSRYANIYEGMAMAIRKNAGAISPMPYRPEDFNGRDYFVEEILETGIRIV